MGQCFECEADTDSECESCGKDVCNGCGVMSSAYDEERDEAYETMHCDKCAPY